MKMNINFSKLFKACLIAAAAIVLAAIAVLAIFGGHTFATYTFANLEIGFILKAVVAGVLVLGLTLIYFLIRFKKIGVTMGLMASMGAAINAAVAFALCVLCRASLGDITFAVMLMAVALSYITFVVFCHSFTVKIARKKNQEAETDRYTAAANKTWNSLLLVLCLICVILVGAFVVSLIFGVKLLALYALPAILTAVFSVVATIAVACRLYADKA